MAMQMRILPAMLLLEFKLSTLKECCDWGEGGGRGGRGGRGRGRGEGGGVMNVATCSHQETAPAWSNWACSPAECSDTQPHTPR